MHLKRVLFSGVLLLSIISNISCSKPHYDELLGCYSVKDDKVFDDQIAKENGKYYYTTLPFKNYKLPLSPMTSENISEYLPSENIEDIKLGLIYKKFKFGILKYKSNVKNKDSEYFFFTHENKQYLFKGNCYEKAKD